MLLTLLLQEHYLGEDDHTNQWPLICVLAFIYGAYKFITSAKNSDSQKNADNVINDVDEKSEQLEQVLPEKKHSLTSAFSGLSTPAPKVESAAQDIDAIKQGQQPEDKEHIKPKIELKGSLANLSLKKATVDSEVSKDAMDEDLKAQNKVILKGSLAGLSFNKSERNISSNPIKEEPEPPASEDDESIV